MIWKLKLKFYILLYKVIVQIIVSIWFLLIPSLMQWGISELCDWLTLRWDEMWGKSVPSPDWSRWRGNDSCAASRLSSHWCRLRVRRERLFLHLSSTALEKEGPEILRQSESFSFSNSFTNRGRQISGLMFERLSSGQLCCFHDSGDSGLCNAADYQIPGETRPPNIWHETRKLNRGEILQPR